MLHLFSSCAVPVLGIVEVVTLLTDAAVSMLVSVHVYQADLLYLLVVCEKMLQTVLWLAMKQSLYNRECMTTVVPSGVCIAVVNCVCRSAITHQLLQCTPRASCGHPGRSSQCLASSVANMYRLFRLVGDVSLSSLVLLLQRPWLI